jgi:DNA-binding beta-propeller fold protein YncE
VDNRPVRNFTRLAVAIVVAALVISAVALSYSSLQPTVTRTVAPINTTYTNVISTVTSTYTTIQTVTITKTVGTVTETATTASQFGAPDIGTITIANLTVGSGLQNLAINPSTNGVYVPGNGGSLYVINATSGKVSSTADSVGSLYLAVDPQTNRIYLNNDDCPPCAQSVVVVDGSTSHVVGSINLGTYVDGLDVNPTTDMVYASSADTESLYIINGATNSLVQNVSLGGYAMGVAVNDKTNIVYVPVCTDSFACTPAFVAAIDGKTGSIISKTSIGLPFAIAVNPDTNTIYVTTSQNDLLSINGTAGSVTDTRLSAYAMECRSLAVNSLTDEVYVSCGARSGLPSFFIIDGRNGNILNSFVDNDQPAGVAFDPNGGSLYLVHSGGFVLVLQSATYEVP